MGVNQDEKEEEVSRRIRRVSRVMAIVFMFWFGAQWFGARLGLPDIILPILDLLAIFAFIWSLLEIWNITKIMRKD